MLVSPQSLCDLVSLPFQSYLSNPSHTYGFSIVPPPPTSRALKHVVTSPQNVLFSFSSLIYLRGLDLKTFPWKAFSDHPDMDTFSHRTQYLQFVTLDSSKLAKADSSYCYRNMAVHLVLLIFSLWIDL